MMRYKHVIDIRNPLWHAIEKINDHSWRVVKLKAKKCLESSVALRTLVSVAIHKEQGDK